MQLPINASQLIDFLPHRPPMLWVDQITDVGNDYKALTGTCVVNIVPEALYVSNGDELRGSSAIEFTAQAFGYLKAAYQVLNNFEDPPSKVFLTGVRHCHADFSQFDIKKHSQLEVKISVVRELKPLTFVKGQLTLPGQSEVLAEAEIQVYFD